MEGPAEIDMRCSVVVFKNNEVLLVHRARDGADDWVLPGGTRCSASTRKSPQR